MSFSLRAARAIARRLADLDPAAAPRACLLRAPRAGLGRAVGVLSGSFDPLTCAHAALAAAALRHGGVDSVLFLLSVHTVDKEDRVVATLPDRALVLLRHVARRPRCGVAVCNRGLYAEQAEALAALLASGQAPGTCGAGAVPPRASAGEQSLALWFVVGFDKIVQIFDPRYYADRDAALRALFARAGLLVAPRGAAGSEALAALLARPENAPYRDRVRPLPLSASYRAVSATAVRAALARGEDARAWLAPAAAAFVAATGCYVDPARYAVRRAALAG
jgi:nicotinic acid mononucleotide adenylyltransferase